MSDHSLSREEREAAEEEEEVLEVVQQGIPQIPIDLFVKKNRSRIRFTDSFDNLVYKVTGTPQRERVLSDSSGNPLISILRSHDGSWKGFRGDGCVEELVFKVEQTLNTFNKVEFNALLTGANGANFTFAMRGCCFWRSCTIYQDQSIIAQTNLMYKLGFRKIFVRRSKFRVTIFPGFVDYNFIAALILVFLDGRKQ